MAFDYNAILVETVIPLMIEFGFETTLKRNTSINDWDKKYDDIEGYYYYENKITGEITVSLDSATQMFPVQVLQVEIDKLEIDGTNVLTGDKVIYMTPSDISPVVNDYIALEQEYRIYRSDPIAPANIVVLHKLYVRK